MATGGRSCSSTLWSIHMPLSRCRIQAVLYLLVVLVVLATDKVVVAAAAQPWQPVACPPPRSAAGAGGIQTYHVTAGRCDIALVAGGAQPLPALSNSSSSSSNGSIYQLAPASVIDGTLDTDLRPIRLPVPLRLTSSSAQAALQLAVPPDGNVTLQDLYLAAVELESPTSGDLNKVLLPKAVQLPPGTNLLLVDVVLEVSPQQLAEYVEFWRRLPSAPAWTDNSTFLYVLNYTQPPTGLVDARSVLLVAPTAASYRGQPLTATQASLAAVTDSYVLGTDNVSTADWIRMLGAPNTTSPAFVMIASYVSLAPRFDPVWPPGGISIRRPLLLAGPYTRPTSVDFGMQAGQFNIQAPNGNVSLVNLYLENLPLGTAAQSATAGGNSILLQNQLWAFNYVREEPRLVLYNVVEVLPQDSIDTIIYWANAFNSPTEFWRNSTRFLRDKLRYTVLKFQRGQRPGEFIIQQAIKKDQFMYNISYTTQNLAAPPLPPNYDPAVHGLLTAQAVDPVVGLVHNVSELQFAVWNQAQGQCNRAHVLLMNKSIDLSPVGQLPVPEAIDDGRNTSAAVSQLSSWPPKGGLPVDCPVQIVGSAQDAAGASGVASGRLLQLQLQYTPARLFDLTGSDPSDAPVLKLRSVRLVGLPQLSAAGNGAGVPAAVQQSLGLWTFPLWFIHRNMTADAPAQVGLTNVTMAVPRPEFQLLSQLVAVSPDFEVPASLSNSTGYPPAAGLARKLLQQASPGPLNFLFIGTARLLPDRLCVNQLSGLGLNGSSVCFTPETSSAAPGYVPPVGTATVNNNPRQGWAPWQYALVIVLPVLAVAALAAVLLCLWRSRRRQRKQLQLVEVGKPVSSEQLVQADGISGQPWGVGCSDRAAAAAAATVATTASGRAPSTQCSTSTSSSGRPQFTTRQSASRISEPPGGSPFEISPVTSSSQGGITGYVSGRGSSSSAEVSSVMGPLTWCQSPPAAAGCQLASHALQPSYPSKVSSGASSQPGGGSGTATWQRLSSAIYSISNELQIKRLEAAFNMAAATGTLKGVGGLADPTAGLPGLASVTEAGPSRLYPGTASAASSSSSPATSQGVALPRLSSSGVQAAASDSPRIQQQQAPLGRRSASAQRIIKKQQLKLHETIGKGTFGVVYRATWRGIPAAVKVLQLSAAAWSGQQTSVREQMAVMEAVLSTTLSHPNTVQVYTYMLRPVTRMEGSAAAEPGQPPLEQAADDPSSSSSTLGGLGGVGSSGRGGGGRMEVVVAWELLLVMEYCELGSLRSAIMEGLLDDRVTGLPHYPTILSIALDVARAMLHLHSEGIVHGDLKAGNVLLRSAMASQRRSNITATAALGSTAPWPGQELLVAKVADFGLACQLQDMDTHISGVHRGTLTHMAPELLLHGHASKASDVYAFGILLWELYTARRAFQGVPKVLLGHLVCESRQRPAWTGEVPPDFQQLVQCCWAHDSKSRPAFDSICTQLEGMLDKEEQTRAQLADRLGISNAAATPVTPPAAGGMGVLPPTSAAAPGSSEEMGSPISAAGVAGGGRPSISGFATAASHEGTGSVGGSPSEPAWSRSPMELQPCAGLLSPFAAAQPAPGDTG